VLSLLVLVAVTRVFIKVEFPIGATINAKLDWPLGILRGVFDLRAHREDGTSSLKERNTFKGRVGFDLLPACEAAKRKLAPPVSRETVRILLESHDLNPWREKAGVSRKSIRNTSPAWKMCWRCMGNLFLRRNHWSDG
jgi:hypothetical protein